MNYRIIFCKIVNILKKTDQYQNTILLFLSDNGAKFDKKEEGKNSLQTYY